MTTEAMLGMFALVGAVVVVAALLSGFIERSGLPQVAVFLGLGAALGSFGLGVLDVGLDSPFLRVAATLSLALVLFTDALTLDVAEVRRHFGLAGIILGPGTLLSSALIALAAWALLGLAPAAALILGAAAASTDPVLLRGLLRHPGLPAETRLALRLESGMNDVVLLPLVLVGMALLQRQDGLDPARLAFNMLVLGPVAGFAVAFAAIRLLEWMRARVGVRRDYESLFSIGVALAAFALAESLHGSGFLAAFAAGLTIAALDVELCDCFREYGETTAELLLLFTFVLLGGSLIWEAFRELTWLAALFVLVALLARPFSLVAALAPTRMEPRALRLTAWFGPRGLSALLLVLLPAFENVPGAGRLFSLCALAVLASIVLHGGSMMLFFRNRGAPVPDSADEVRANPRELLDRRLAGEDVWLLDVRSDEAYAKSSEQLEGARRIDLQRPVESTRELGVPDDAWAALFCT